MKRRPSPPGRTGGLTLIELSVALAIFAVLGMLSYRALNTAAESTAHLERRVQRWEALARAFGRIEAELATIVPDNQSAAPGLQENGSELSFLRLDAARGVRRVAFRLNGGQLEWLLWEGRERNGVPQVVVLLDGVRGVRWQFAERGRRLAGWPPASGRLPAGIGIALDLPDLGQFQRLFALH